MSKEKYRVTQNKMDIIAMIPEWSLGYEMLSSIAIIVVSVILKSFAIFYLGAWLLALGISLGMAKEINGLKEDLRSPDLEKRRAAMEEVESDKQIVIMTSLFLFLVDLFILITALPDAVLHSSIFARAEVIITIVLVPISFLPSCIVYEQADKVMPPEPEKAARAAS